MKQYIINAFSDQPFTGNPAAVCILDTCLSNLEILASSSSEVPATGPA